MHQLKEHCLKAYVLEKAENDFIFFATYFFDHFLAYPNSSFHRFLYNELERITKAEISQMVAIAAPRGNAKSSITSLIFPLWCAIFKKKKFIIIISDTATQANLFLEGIRSEVESNEKLKDIFGELAGVIWRAEDIVFKNDIRITALGARKKIRGLRHKESRPDLIILDDIENDENTESPDQRKKIYDWYSKAVSKAGDNNTDIIIVGTILHYNSLLAKLLNNPLYKSRKFQAVKKFSESPLWEKWEEISLLMNEEEKRLDPNPSEKFYQDNREEMLKGVEVLWPEGQPYFKLMQAKLVDGSASFDSEFQNNPINPDDCLFKEEWFSYFDPEWEEYTEFVGACDPSLGKTAKSDYSAIIILAKHKKGYLDVIVADVERRHPDKIKDDIFQICSALLKDRPTIPIKDFAIESVQFQEYFRDVLNRESAIKGLYIPFSATENQTTRKTLRIETLQPLIKNGIIRFRKNQSRLLEQLRYYPKAENDDAPDALEMAVRKSRTPIFTTYKY